MHSNWNLTVAVAAAVAVTLVCCTTFAFVRADDPDQNRNGPELIFSKGYPVEIHYVQTPDHYILQMFRIPRPNAPPVLLQHGLLDSADTWILNYANNSLAFIMYDAGFDVWLGNSRGNKYSRNNTQHSPNFPFDGPFWDFTFDDMAQYDMPTQIDYALSVNGRSKLVFVGHSQGCAQAFANFATPSWSSQDKVSLFIALAPADRVYHTSSLLVRALADFDIDRLIQFFGVHEFLPSTAFLQWLLPDVCNATPGLCDTAIYIFAGLDQSDLDQNRMPVYVSHFPSGTSVKNMVHWSQEVRADRFGEYDYGLLNYLHYQSLSAPNYDLSKIASPPIAVFYGGNDALADPTDVEYILSSLPASTLVASELIQPYAHLDFVWGEHADTTVYNKVVTLAQQYS